MRKMRVLVVDDNKEFVGLLREYLEKQEDIEVAGVAYNGVEALESIQGSHLILWFLTSSCRIWTESVSLSDSPKKMHRLARRL